MPISSKKRLSCFLRFLHSGSFDSLSISNAVCFQVTQHQYLLYELPWRSTSTLSVMLSFLLCLSPSLFKDVLFLRQWLSLCYCLHLSFSFSRTFTTSLSLFSSHFPTLSLPSSLTLCMCQSVRRVDQTHGRPQRVTQSGHCQQGLLTAFRSLSRADAGDKLDPCSGGSWSEAPGVAA